MTHGTSSERLLQEDIEAALARAAESARRLATAAGRPIVLYQDGRIVKEYPGGERAPSTPVREAG